MNFFSFFLIFALFVADNEAGFELSEDFFISFRNFLAGVAFC